MQHQNFFSPPSEARWFPFSGRFGRRKGVAKRPPPLGAKPPPLGAKPPPLLWARLRSLVFWGRVVLNVGGFGRNLVGMVFGTSLRDYQADFVIRHQMPEVLAAEVKNMGVWAIFGDFKAI